MNTIHTQHDLDARESAEAARDLLATLEQAWNAGDGHAYAAPFTDDALFVNIYGTVIRGREAIAGGHQHIFDTIYAGSRNRIELVEARPLADGVVRLLVHAELHVPAGPLAGDMTANATAILEHSDAGWRISAFHNTRETM